MSCPFSTDICTQLHDNHQENNGKLLKFAIKRTLVKVRIFSVEYVSINQFLFKKVTTFTLLGAKSCVI